MIVRPADSSEIDQIAQVWHAAWHDGHGSLLPPAVVAMRTLESFRTRIARDLSLISVAGPVGRPVGLCTIKGDELNQLFVSAAARGTGLAGALLADGERRLKAKGVETAWLSCAIGNDRAARFYEKSGWRMVGTMIAELEATTPPASLESWRFEKRLVG